MNNNGDVATRLLGHAALLAAGALLGTAFDHIHVATGVLAYQRPAFWGEAAWVPALFGSAAVSLALSWRLVFRRETDPAPGLARVAFEIAWFGAVYATTALLRAHPWLVLALLTAAWVARLAPRFDRRVILYSLTVAAAGPVVEATLCHAGAFHYTAPDVLRVVVWLPALYLHAALMMRAVDLAFFSAPSRRAPAPPR